MTCQHSLLTYGTAVQLRRSPASNPAIPCRKKGISSNFATSSHNPIHQPNYAQRMLINRTKPIFNHIKDIHKAPSCLKLLIQLLQELPHPLLHLLRPLPHVTVPLLLPRGLMVHRPRFLLRRPEKLLVRRARICSHTRTSILKLRISSRRRRRERLVRLRRVARRGHGRVADRAGGLH